MWASDWGLEGNVCVQDDQRLYLPEGQHTDPCHLAAQIRMKWQDWHYNKYIFHLIARRTVQIAAESYANMLYGTNSLYLPDLEDLETGILAKWREKVNPLKSKVNLASSQ